MSRRSSRHVRARAGVLRFFRSETVPIGPTGIAPFAGTVIAMVVILAAGPEIFAGTAAAAAPTPKCQITQGNSTDPNYTPNPPLRSHVGTGFVLSGILRSGIDCAVIPKARVEFWLAGPNGYDEAHRGTVITDGSGRYRIESNFPVASFGRPHIHLRVAVPGFKPLAITFLPTPGTTAGTLDLVLEPEV